jgi:hypothetical protein
VASLVNTGEREVTILASLAIFHTIHGERSISRGAEFFTVLVIGFKRDCLATEPVTDVIRVTIDESDAHWSGEDVFQVFDEVRPDKVTGLLEGVVNFSVGLSVVEVDSQGVLDFVFGEVVDVVAGRGGVLGWVADIVRAAATEDVVRALCGEVLKFKI